MHPKASQPLWHNATICDADEDINAVTEKPFKNHVSHVEGLGRRRKRSVPFRLQYAELPN